MTNVVEIPALALSQNAFCGASTSMGALAPNIFYYHLSDMHSFPRSRNLLCVLGLRLAVGINSSFLVMSCLILSVTEKLNRCSRAVRACNFDQLAIIQQLSATEFEIKR